MGYYSSLDIDLNSPCYELSSIQDTLDNPSNNQTSADHELIREVLLTLIKEHKEIHANYEDHLMTRLYQIDALERKQQRRLMQEADRYVQLSIFDSTIVNSH